MKKRLFWPLLAIALVLLICLVTLLVLLSLFFKPGIHIMGRYAHIDIQEPCFLMSSDNQIVAESTLTVSGYLFDNTRPNKQSVDEGSKFYGLVDVAAYPIPVEDSYRNFWGSILDDKIYLSCQGINLVREDCDTFYNLEILRSDHNVKIVYIFQDEVCVAIAISGATKEEAMENYQRYLDSF